MLSYYKIRLKLKKMLLRELTKSIRDDINYVLERCFKPGIISTAFVGQGVEAENLNTILE